MIINLKDREGKINVAGPIQNMITFENLKKIDKSNFR